MAELRAQTLAVAATLTPVVDRLVARAAASREVK
jgi:hypothetical protein